MRDSSKLWPGITEESFAALAASVAQGLTNVPFLSEPVPRGQASNIEQELGSRLPRRWITRHMEDREHYHMIGMKLIVHTVRPPGNRGFSDPGPNLRVSVGLSGDSVEHLPHGSNEPKSQPAALGLIPVGSIVVLGLGNPPP